MIAIAISGAPGAGKGTQSNLLVEKYDFCYISTGDALRSEIANETELGKSVKEIIDRGDLVSDEIVGKIIENVVKKAKKDKKTGILFDGYPRTLGQAKMLDNLLKKEDIEFKGLIMLEVEEQILIDRILKRALDSGRSDDNEVSVKQRLQSYKDKTTPIFDYYKSQNKYYGINGVGEIKDIFKLISEVIDKF
ncbi:MAG: adenylate kinase [Bacteroidales bacterium]|jgi:adenylate kinase